MTEKERILEARRMLAYLRVDLELIANTRFTDSLIYARTSQCNSLIGQLSASLCDLEASLGHA